MRSSNRLGTSLARTTRALLALLGAVTMSGCYFVQSPTRPINGLTVLREADTRQSCLVVFLPGMLDGPDTYLDNQLPQDLVRSGAPCDSVSVNLHVRYYAQGGIADALYEDVIASAIARGYREIWLVGISMGGIGALLTSTQHADRITGILLLSPFLGDDVVVRAIADAGGLAEWEPATDLGERMDEANYTQFVWRWLRGYVEDPEAMPALYLGWANGERVAPAAEMVAAALPEGHVVAVDGRHTWATWRPLFRTLIGRARPGHETAAR